MPLQAAITLKVKQYEVAVLLAAGTLGTHAGILFNMRGRGPQVFHLRFHQDVAVESIAESRLNWLGTIVSMPLIKAQILATILDNVALSAIKNGRLISFGPDARASQGSISNTGYATPNGSLGLTCATFVSELFAGGGVPLVNVGTWPITSANLIWLDRVCKLLRFVGANEQHITRVRLVQQPVRVLPEEVAAAADQIFTSRPLDYSVCEKLAVTALDSLDALGGATRLIDNLTQSIQEAYSKPKINWRLEKLPSAQRTSSNVDSERAHSLQTIVGRLPLPRNLTA